MCAINVIRVESLFVVHLSIHYSPKEKKELNTKQLLFPLSFFQLTILFCPYSYSPIYTQLEDPSIDIHKQGKYLMLAVQELVSGDQCEGRFVFGRESKKAKVVTTETDRFTRDGGNPKSLLQTLLMRAGHSPPKYKTKHLKTNEFRALVEFKGMQFVGKPKKNKQLAERDAAIEALAWLTHTSDNNKEEDDNSPPDVTDNMLKLLGRRRRSKRRPG